MGLTLKKIAREVSRPFKQLVAREKYAFKLKLKDPPPYDEDWIISFHNTAFTKDPSFVAAYQRGVKAAGYDANYRWRIHVGLWVAAQAVHLEGDFVECGVNKGVLSSSIMEYLNWNTLNKSFYLYDTFRGLDAALMNKEELSTFDPAKNYPECYEEAQKNFKEYKNVHLIRGSVPATLAEAPVDKVCYLSIDMNCVAPEIAAAEYFWPKLVKGGFILLDDYAYKGFDLQHQAFDDFAKQKGVEVLSLPTGQGLIMKR